MINDISLLEKHLKKTAVVSNVLSIMVALVVAMSVGYGFYYNTKSTLESHSEDIQEVRTTVESVEDHLNDIDVFQGMSKTEMKSIEDKVEKNLQYIEKMDEKLDKILYQTR